MSENYFLYPVLFLSTYAIEYTCTQDTKIQINISTQTYHTANRIQNYISVKHHENTAQHNSTFIIAINSDGTKLIPGNASRLYL